MTGIIAKIDDQCHAAARLAQWLAGMKSVILLRMRTIGWIVALAAMLMIDVTGARVRAATLYPVTDCSQLATQMELNQCAGANYKSADTALNRLYQQVMGQVTDAASKQRLKDAERGWIAYRDKKCFSEVGPQQEGGSIWPMEMSNCLEELTAARIRELTKMRGCSAGVSACTPH
jgi:uncharacterized protein YecT (DUF1311 family)